MDRAAEKRYSDQKDLCDGLKLVSRTACGSSARSAWHRHHLLIYFHRFYRRSQPLRITTFVNGLSQSRSFRALRGGTIRRGGITRPATAKLDACSSSAWSYQYPARIAKERQRSSSGLPKKIRDIAWKAQTRLCTRYRSMIARGKKPTVVVAAIARELAGFIWAICQEMRVMMSASQIKLCTVASTQPRARRLPLSRVRRLLECLQGSAEDSD